MRASAVAAILALTAPLAFADSTANGNELAPALSGGPVAYGGVPHPHQIRDAEPEPFALAETDSDADSDAEVWPEVDSYPEVAADVSPETRWRSHIKRDADSLPESISALADGLRAVVKRDADTLPVPDSSPAAEVDADAEAIAEPNKTTQKICDWFKHAGESIKIEAEVHAEVDSDAESWE